MFAVRLHNGGFLPYELLSKVVYGLIMRQSAILAFYQTTNLTPRMTHRSL